MRAKNTKLSLKLSWFAALKSLQQGVSKFNDGLHSKSFAANGFNQLKFVRLTDFYHKVNLKYHMMNKQLLKTDIDLQIEQLLTPNFSVKTVST